MGNIIDEYLSTQEILFQECLLLTQKVFPKSLLLIQDRNVQSWSSSFHLCLNHLFHLHFIYAEKDSLPQKDKISFKMFTHKCNLSTFICIIFTESLLRARHWAKL